MAKRQRKARLLEDQYPTHYLPNVGRQVMQEGGVPEAEGDVSFAPPEVEARQAYDVSPIIDQNVARTAREALERNRDRPFENASDFVRHQLNKDEPQLPQYDREGVKAWQEGAKELAHIGAYGIPVVGEGLAAYDLANAARDVMSPEFREAVKNKDYLSSGATLGGLGLAALGAPGRLAKAAAAAGAVMMPQDAEAGVVDRALKAIRAYHGSPHKFDRFDISKIGTGEGAQAYGHGLYFAENEGVAKSYRDDLSSKISVDGKLILDKNKQVGSTGDDYIDDILMAHHGDLNSAIEDEKIHIKSLRDLKFPTGHVEDTIKRLEELRGRVNASKTGHMYEVDIHANPEHLLDWDKPLSEQSSAVRKYLSNTDVKPVSGFNMKDIIGTIDAAQSDPRLYHLISSRGSPVNPQGSSLYEMLANNRGAVNWPITADAATRQKYRQIGASGASEMLREAGIPGIKYLDRGSRGSGEGSHNYVMFDPNLIDIMRRYAQGGDVEGYDNGGPVKNIPRADDEDFFRRLALWTYAVSPLFSPTSKLGQKRLGYQEGGAPKEAGIVDKALDFLSQFNPVGTAEAGPLSKAAQEALMAVHNIKSHRANMLEKLGGLPVPSIAITKPEQEFKSFGDISLVGSPKMATPSAKNPVFAADVYSPRFPSVDEETGKIFRGFTPLGNRRYAPLTMENVVREMKGNVRGGEGGLGVYGSGSLRAAVTPQFRSLAEIQKSREKIIPREDFKSHKDEANDLLIGLADEFHPYSQYSGSGFQHVGSLMETLSDVGRGKLSAFNQDYKGLPDELKTKALEYLDYLKKMPTEYFEAKPQRAVGLHEFEGAVVPHEIASQSPEVLDTLKRLGIKRIEEFDPEASGSQAEAFRKFREFHFKDGGSVIDRALDVVSSIPQ